jgi:hypothetical protein
VAYTLHKTVTRKLARNPYVVKNLMDVWDVDIRDVQNIAKYNDGVKYLLTLIDVFSNFCK